MILQTDNVTLTLNPMNDPPVVGSYRLDKIFACLPVGREEFLTDLGSPHDSVRDYGFSENYLDI